MNATGKEYPPRATCPVPEVDPMSSTLTNIGPSAATRRRAWTALALGGGLLAALAGCSSNAKLDPFTTSSVVADDYKITHAITNKEQTVSLEIPVGAYEQRLTEGERGNVNFFAQNFLASGAALVGIAQPTGSANQASAARVAVEIQAELVKAGIPAAVIRKGSYAADANDTVAPVRLAYRAIVASTDPCGSWPDLATNTEQNRHFHNYGCATQQNLAAEVDNPLDLQYPRGSTPPDAARRAAVLLKYRQGEKTTSDYSGETGGTVATGVGQ